MKRYFDKKHNRLVYIKNNATSAFWDKLWQQHGIEKNFCKPPANRFMLNLSKKYLPQGARVLEGGCGMGDKIYRLAEAGFDTEGIDFARGTIALIRKNWPHLKVHLADVRSLPFKDNSFDGYWSFGVIEHSYNGYEDIISEMYRIIKPGGYLFITFPHMNWIRKYKASRKGYPPYQEEIANTERFYQFVLDAKLVINNLSDIGFDFISSTNLAGFKNLKDEVSLLKMPLTKLQSSRALLARVVRKAIDIVICPIAGHVFVGIFKKKQ